MENSLAVYELLSAVFENYCAKRAHFLDVLVSVKT